MTRFPKPSRLPRHLRGFSLVEMLIVIAIISVLMTVGSIGLSNLGGRGVTSGVDSTEALFDEARSLAISKGLRSCVLVAKKLDNNRSEELRRVLVAHEKQAPDGGPIKDASGQPVSSPDWVLSSRGLLLPDQTFFSNKFSKTNHQTGSGEIESIPSSRLVDAKASFRGEYYVYEFNPQGIPKYAYASFVIGSGARNLTQPATSSPPKVVNSAKRDFGGFVVWRNGSTSAFRSPGQISTQIPNISAGTTF